MHGMEAAVIELCAYELEIAVGALIVLQSGVNLEVDVLPGHSLLSEVHHELVDVPGLIRNVLGYHSAVGVHEDLSLRALHPLSLTQSVQGIAVHTPLKHVGLIFKEYF